MPVSFDTSMDEGYRMSMGVDTTGVPPGIGPGLDGFYCRRGDEGIAYVGDAEADYDQVMRTIETATTAVLGRVNADEFLGLVA